MTVLSPPEDFGTMKIREYHPGVVTSRTSSRAFLSSSSLMAGEIR